MKPISITNNINSLAHGDKYTDNQNNKRNILADIPLITLSDSVGVRTQDPQLRRLLL